MSRSDALPSLPNLLYLGDVPVESSYHGSALIYRLLQNYPKEKLRCVEAIYRSKPERRLPEVIYETGSFGSRRLLHSRLGMNYRTWLLATACARVGLVGRALRGFIPQAVLTVAHGFSWMTASVFARRQRLSLHLIVHDDCCTLAFPPGASQRRMHARFVDAYRFAAARFCVSPYMEEEYRRRYGAEGIVLYPSRAADGAKFSQPAERLSRPAPNLTIAFAGTMESDGYAQILQKVAHCLQTRNGKLVVYGPYTPKTLGNWGLDLPAVRCEGLVPSNELIDRLRNQADALIVPMSFEVGGEETNMRFSFPSKLTDYTATGLPLLICGPEYCSAVRWAQQYQPVAEVVTSESSDALARALDHLASPEHRKMLANRALEVGEKLFSHASAERVFFAALQTVCAESAVARK